LNLILFFQLSPFAHQSNGKALRWPKMMQAMGDYSERQQIWQAFANILWVSADKSRITQRTFMKKDFQLKPRV
jgi:hypothetical protein